MSVLYDALKKAEENQNKKDNINTSAARKNQIIVAIALLAVVIAIFLVNQYFKKTIFQTITVENATVPPFLDTSAMSKATTLKWSDKYSLQGIIYDNKSPTAVINGKILRQKDKIDDIEVTNITPRKV